MNVSYISVPQMIPGCPLPGGYGYDVIIGENEVVLPPTPLITDAEIHIPRQEFDEQLRKGLIKVIE